MLLLDSVDCVCYLIIVVSAETAQQPCYTNIKYIYFSQTKAKSDMQVES